MKHRRNILLASWFAVSLLAVAGGGADGAVDTPLRWRVEGGSAQRADVDGDALTVIRASGGSVTAESSAVPVEPDTIYRVKLRVRRGIGAHLNLDAVETPGDASHDLSFWPGTRPVPPHATVAEAWLATSPRAERIRLSLTLRDDRKVDAQGEALEAGIALLSITPVRQVGAPPTPSANYVRNGRGERVDAQGHPVGFAPWGGTQQHPQRAVGEGREDSAALRLEGGGFLHCADLPAVAHRRFRFRLHARGRGRLTLRFRTSNDRNQRIGRGTSPRHFGVNSDEWTRCATQTVVLPDVAELGAIIQYRVPEGASLYIDDVSVRMVTFDRNHAADETQPNAKTSAPASADQRP